jgi:hypothetical protein
MFEELMYLLVIYLSIGMIGAAIVGAIGAWEHWRYPSASDLAYILTHQFLALIGWPIMLIILIRNLKQRYYD